jgi:hypothetical protein
MARMEISNGGSDLRTHLATTRGGRGLLEVDAWIPSEVKAISPLVERLMRLIEGSHCVTGDEDEVQLALREALNNAVVHGNRLDARNERSSRKADTKREKRPKSPAKTGRFANTSTSIVFARRAPPDGMKPAYQFAQSRTGWVTRVLKRR